MKRKITTIDEEKCNGCGKCIPGCPEGAIGIVDGKARLLSDVMCDGLGACLGKCPEGAITVEERDAGTYDERRVMANVAKEGSDAISGHLRHLKEHGLTEELGQAIACLNATGLQVPEIKDAPVERERFAGWPGSRRWPSPANKRKRRRRRTFRGSRTGPIQMHLINPQAPHYRGADVVLAADCVAYAMGNFHATAICAARRWQSPARSWTTALTATVKKSLRSSMTRRSIR